jgi:hypothetical protein
MQVHVKEIPRELNERTDWLALISHKKETLKGFTRLCEHALPWYILIAEGHPLYKIDLGVQTLMLELLILHIQAYIQFEMGMELEYKWISKIIVPACYKDVLNSGNFPSKEHFKSLGANKTPETKVHQMMSKYFWKLAGFREQSMPDGSLVFFLCPLFMRGFKPLKPIAQKRNVRELASPIASTPPSKAVCLPRDNSAFARVSKDSA